MGDVIQGYSKILTMIVNFLYDLKFDDGTSLGGYLLAVCVLSLIIRFLFRNTWAGSVNFDSINRYNENQVISSAHNILSRGD